MKALYKFFGVSALAVLTMGAVSCVEEDALEIQKPYTYDDQYFSNLREFKASEHCLSYAYFAAYEQQSSNLPASWGKRIRGLPDSLDICNLWMGIPTDSNPDSDTYWPLACEDMHYCQQTLGTRFVSHADACNQIRTVEGVEYDFSIDTENTIKAYGQQLVDVALANGIDGIDVDFEPNWSGWNTDNLLILAETIGKTFGPKGTMPDKLFIIDFYGDGDLITPEIGQYVSYFVIQAYTQGFTEHSVYYLQHWYYDQIGDWVEPGKVIVCENFGTWYADGGSPFNDEDGNPMYTTDGSRMYSLEGMARWNPTQGTKAGFGAYYMDRDYYSSTGIPYYNFRRCIQIANPAIY